MKRPKKTYLVNEEDLEILEYNKPQEDLFMGRKRTCYCEQSI